MHHGRCHFGSMCATHFFPVDPFFIALVVASSVAMVTVVKGTVTTWRNDMGHGYITDDKSGEVAVVHRSVLKDCDRLSEGMHAKYQANGDDNDVYVASEVSLDWSTGTISTWISDMGYGFVTDEDAAEDAFVHRSVLVDSAYMEVGEKVYFKAKWDSSGHFVASEVGLDWSTIVARHERGVARALIADYLARQEADSVSDEAERRRTGTAHWPGMD
jgi:cold shock CspA family protein